ncbi:MAG: RDD family protein, partial [Bacteroidota bacterium]
MSIVRIPTNFNIDLDFEVPEFYRRLMAWLLDIVLLFFYIRIANEIFKSIIGNRTVFGTNDAYNMQFISIILWLPVFIYHPICEITMNGQSIGKKLTGLQVVNETGGRPAISQFLIRWLIRTADIMIVIILLYNVLVILDGRLLWALIGSILLVITDIVLVVS